MSPTRLVANPLGRLASSPRLQLATAFGLGMFTALAIQSLWGLWRAGTAPTVSAPVHPADARVALDLNTATAEELQHLPGVGAGLASRIAAHRDKRGGFDSVEQLTEVPGVGPGLMERIRPQVRVQPRRGGETAPSPAQDPEETAGGTPPRGEAPFRSRKLGEQERAAVDLNRAGVEELERLPGIGPTLAHRIVADRVVQGPFRSVNDLTRVRGIGPKTVEKLRPYVRVSEEYADSRTRPPDAGDR